MAFSAEYIYRIIDNYTGPLKRITAATERFKAVASRAQNQARMMGQGMRDAGSKMTAGLTLPIVGMGIAAAKTAIDFQNAFIGVQKTVDASAGQLARMRGEFEKMSTIMPVSATELMKIGESAGQLGIQTKKITSFTKTIAMLGATTNLSGEEGATQLARFANITQMSQDNFDRLGSTIVHLGNNLATTEAEIVAMGMRLAGAGNVVKLSESQIMAMAGTLTSLGINAEAGGTAFSKVMLNINDAVAKGGSMLSYFAKVSGQSSKQFADTFKKDAAKGILTFVEGLGKLRAEGKNVTAILEAMEFNDIRVRDALLRASGSGDLFRKAMQMGNEAWKANNALTKEARLRFQSWSSQLVIAWNKLKLFANEIGKILVPMFINFVDLILPVLKWFGDLSPVIKKVIIVIAGLTAAIGPLLTVAGMMAIAISAITVPMLTIAGIIAGAIAMIAYLTAAFVQVWKRSIDFRLAIANLADAFSPLIELVKPLFFWIGEKLGLAFNESGSALKLWGDIAAVVINMVAGLIKGLIELVMQAGRFWKNIFSGDILGAIKEIPGVSGLMDKIGLGSATDKAASRQDNKLEVSGQIGVSASGGAKVESAQIGLNTGYNLAVAQ